MPATIKSVSEEKSPYGVNKALFDQSAKIKDKMELLEKRLQKMMEHKQEVSESVFLRVKSDYEAQIEEVRRSFEEKCQQIEGELQNLYQLKAQQQTALGKHEEILEEAQFRHKLAEYTDKKYKEIEALQNREIKKYKDTLGKLADSIQQYERILGHPFSPDSFQEAPSPSISEPEHTPATGIPAELSGFPALKDDDTSRTKEAFGSVSSNTDKISSSGGTHKLDDQPEEFSEKLDQELDSLLQTEGNYFDGGKNAPVQEDTGPQPVPEVKPAQKPAEKKKEIAKVSTTKPDDDSISSILRDIPLEEVPEEGEAKKSEEATGKKIDLKEEGEASLLVLEGELEMPEYTLQENTSIGRSPSNDIVLKETKVSRQHATINYRDGNYIIVDLKSSNGILINGKKLDEATLKDGDEVKVGSFKFQFNIL